ncbi:unnamed protein product [Didymodactylos carnosus]|uniref:Medium-chain acyl-CoA ligase ACSF2, mitochondrial n=2 Tax=Didymodactylos carnosus TaxID=1234261 RepID=A0A8S2PUZ2_9BILA|nr:unnamed protein product [Didymodactylos carnosus]CAF4072160.1 unnamed protein product [Didymodactylos carnosus]
MIVGNLACTVTGACIVIPCEIFDAEQVMKCVEQEKCSSLYGVPTMFIAELDHANFVKYNFSSLRTGIMAGSICSTELMKTVQSKMNIKELAVCYGMTETSPVSTQTLPNDTLENRVTTVGKVQDHVEIKIINIHSNETVQRGQIGEFCARGYHVMIGYWNNKVETEKIIDNEGWLHSGDLAIMNDDGYIKIVGRINDMIVRGGENIYPKEIEELLCKHPAISDVYVIGIPDRKYGEQVMAWVKLKSNITEVNEEALHDFCKNQISHYKIPQYWKFVQAFPVTVTGKIRKVEMREIAIQELNLKLEKP